MTPIEEEQVDEAKKEQLEALGDHALHGVEDAADVLAHGVAGAAKGVADGVESASAQTKARERESS